MDIEFEHPLKNKKRTIKTKNKIVLDSIVIKNQKIKSIQLSKIHSTINNNIQNNTHTLLLGDGRTDFFVTEDSRKYITNTQQNKKKIGYNYIDSRGYLDSLNVRYERVYTTGELQHKRIVSEFRSAVDIAESFRLALKLDLSPIRMWQVSLAGAVLFGMVSMSMIYNNLGQSAMAKGVEESVKSENKSAVLVIESKKDTVKTENVIEEKTQVKKENPEKTTIKQDNNKKTNKIEKNTQVDSVQKKVDNKQLKNTDNKKTDSLKKNVNEQRTQQIQEKTDKIPVDSVNKQQKKDGVDTKKENDYSLEDRAEEMVDGYPIEKMLPYILKQDPEVAKYLIAMAKQESQWGKRVPVLNGQDCYNYWGYRGKRKLMGSGGHTCFNSRKDAVETVGKRINDLIYKYDRTTANDLIVWKCGNSCAGHSKAGVDRWIGTVGSYYDKLSK